MTFERRYSLTENSLIGLRYYPSMFQPQKAYLPDRSGCSFLRIHLLGWLYLVLALLISSPAFAGNNRYESAASADTEEDPAYRKLIKEGLAEYDARNFQEARSFFQRAHRINPNARTFRGIGMASFELRDYVLAVHNLTAALKDMRKPLSPEQVRHAQDLLERSRLFVDVYRMTVTPKNARVLIDGRVPEFEDDGTLILGFGLHALEASAPGYAIRSLPINVRGGERKDLSITLEKLSDPNQIRPTLPKSMPADLLVDTKPKLESSVFDNPGVLWLMTAGVAAVGAGISGYNWQEQNKEIDKCATPKYQGCKPKMPQEMRDRRNIQMGLAIGGAALAAILSVVSIVTWDSPPDAAQQGLLDCTLTPFGASCARTF